MRPEHRIVRYWLLMLFPLLILPGCSKPWGGSGNNSPIKLSGTVEARDADLSFQVSGRIATMPANEGAAVKKGDVVATLDDSDYKLGLRRAQAEYAAAKIGRAHV